MALFRIIELAGGTIRIDGIDISTIGVKTLQENVSIIPQNPVLFKDTLRAYLDPLNEFGNEELWPCIHQVGLSDRIASEDKKLECTVEENGENFSVGERQVLCMARALLRHSRIVIFDEATAAIDHETDQKLQRVIREAFTESTVVTIAHRLDTVFGLGSHSGTGERRTRGVRAAIIIGGEGQWTLLRPHTRGWRPQHVPPSHRAKQTECLERATGRNTHHGGV